MDGKHQLKYVQTPKKKGLRLVGFRCYPGWNHNGENMCRIANKVVPNVDSAIIAARHRGVANPTIGGIVIDQSLSLKLSSHTSTRHLERMWGIVWDGHHQKDAQLRSPKGKTARPRR